MFVESTCNEDFGKLLSIKLGGIGNLYSIESGIWICGSEISISLAPFHIRELRGGPLTVYFDSSPSGIFTPGKLCTNFQIMPSPLRYS
jgi:hypothetical protein